jgi:hypothetical protein
MRQRPSEDSLMDFKVSYWLLFSSYYKSDNSVGCLVIDADSAKEGRTWEYICKIKHK